MISKQASPSEPWHLTIVSQGNLVHHHVITALKNGGSKTGVFYSEDGAVLRARVIPARAASDGVMLTVEVQTDPLVATETLGSTVKKRPSALQLAPGLD